MLALTDLDKTLVDPRRRIPPLGTNFVTSHALGDGTLAWLKQTDRTVKPRDRFFALHPDRSKPDSASASGSPSSPRSPARVRAAAPPFLIFVREFRA